MREVNIGYSNLNRALRT